MILLLQILQSEYRIIVATQEKIQMKPIACLRLIFSQM